MLGLGAVCLFHKAEAKAKAKANIIQMFHMNVNNYVIIFAYMRSETFEIYG